MIGPQGHPMCEHAPFPGFSLPPLSDEAVIEIQNFIYDVLAVFESRYGDQIYRYYEQPSQHNLIEPERNLPLDDPSF
jgi:hypothetical protein